MVQPSIESARETAFEGLAQEVIGGTLTLDEYAERAVAIRQAATTTNSTLYCKACRRRPLAWLPIAALAGSAPSWLGETSAVAGGCASICGSWLSSR